MIDSHCHFDFAEFEKDRRTIWQSCQTLGIKKLIIPGIHSQQWPIAWQISQELTGIVTACGLHPYFIQDETTSQLQQSLVEFIASHPVVAIGECGLDKVIPINLERQIALLETQLALAHETGLPVILHCRTYHNELIQCLKRWPNLRGVIHGFTGSVELAQNYWQLGFYLGVGGSIRLPTRQENPTSYSHYAIRKPIIRNRCS